jgi:hypothetical protein
MNTLLKKTTFAAGVAAMFGVAPLMLQAETIPSSGPVPFTSYDQNNDGSISEKEFYDVRDKRMKAREESGRMMRNASNAPGFGEFDTNKDGKITPEELQAGQNARMQQRGGQGMGRGAK